MTTSQTSTRERPGLGLLRDAVTVLATVIAVVGLTIAVFFNPLWIAFEQDRAGVPGITGYTPAQVRTVTGSILADLLAGPPEFAVEVDGRPVLDPAERSHMVDVRNVLLPFAGLAGVAILALAAIVAANRRSVRMWRAMAGGAAALAAAGALVGVAVAFFFDAAFLLFHLVFFPQGNFSFDPRTERLTQLFPDQFWTETSFGIAIVGLGFALAVSVVARRQARRWSARQAPPVAPGSRSG